jgi:hypothetical protein
VIRDRLAALREAFSESDLARKSTCSRLEWATTGEDFRRIIARDKVPVATP